VSDTGAVRLTVYSPLLPPPSARPPPTEAEPTTTAAPLTRSAPADVMPAEALRAAAASVPVTVARSATSAPATVAVVPVAPSTTPREAAPIRTVPAVLPVPASTTRSPPGLAEWPAAWPSSTVVRAWVSVLGVRRPMVNTTSLPSCRLPWSTTDPVAVIGPLTLRPRADTVLLLTTAPAHSVPVTDAEPAVSAPATAAPAAVSEPCTATTLLAVPSTTPADDVPTCTLPAPPAPMPASSTSAPPTPAASLVAWPTISVELPAPVSRAGRETVTAAVSGPMRISAPLSCTPPATDSTPAAMIDTPGAPRTTDAESAPRSSRPAVVPAPASSARSPPVPPAACCWPRTKVVAAAVPATVRGMRPSV
jgi:hypothetical protein